MFAPHVFEAIGQFRRHIESGAAASPCLCATPRPSHQNDTSPRQSLHVRLVFDEPPCGSQPQLHHQASAILHIVGGQNLTSRISAIPWGVRIAYFVWNSPMSDLRPPLRVPNPSVTDRFKPTMTLQPMLLDNYGFVGIDRFGLGKVSSTRKPGPLSISRMSAS